ncbi:hypothetical protein [Carnobacterium divergens]
MREVVEIIKGLTILLIIALSTMVALAAVLKVIFFFLKWAFK